MTNKTITLACCTCGKPTACGKMICEECCYEPLPVPPAGGEPDGYKYRIKTRNNRAWTYAKDKPENFTEEFDVVPLYSGDIVTRLQAEVERWKLVAQDFSERRDELKRELDMRELDMRDGERHSLQSELTKARELLIPAECPHMIVFDDAERETLMFAGEGARTAALKTWEQISGSWNAHLFVRVERNSRDDRYPSANQSAPADKGQGEPVADALSTGFYTTETGGGKYAINIAYRSMAEMQAADQQLRDLLRTRHAKPFAWCTEDYLTDKSATTYDLATMARWKAKGWPVTPLYAEKPAPVAVVMPEHRDSDLRSPVYGYARGWNACLDEVARLNGINPE